MLSTPAGPRCFNDEDYSRLCQAAEHPFLDGRPGFDLIGTELIRRAVALLAHDHPYDSAIEWMHALPPWDQVPRIATFCHVYLGADQTPYTLAVSRYLWSAMAGQDSVYQGEGRHRADLRLAARDREIVRRQSDGPTSQRLRGAGLR